MGKVASAKSVALARSWRDVGLLSASRLHRSAANCASFRPVL